MPKHTSAWVPKDYFTIQPIDGVKDEPKCKGGNKEKLQIKRVIMILISNIDHKSKHFQIKLNKSQC